MDGTIRFGKMCTGCMACKNACPVGAIGQRIDKYGFIMPCVDRDKCIGCGACTKVCPTGMCRMFSSSAESDADKSACKIADADKSSCEISDNNKSACNKAATHPLAAFSAYHKDQKVQRISSSGGAFYALAQNVIDNGGIVFGCRYDVKRKTAELVDTDTYPLESILTSKYVESYIGDGLKKVREEVLKGRRVLFCGTPCQTSGAARYIEKTVNICDDKNNVDTGNDRLKSLPDNLLLVDFTCGAVSAQPPLRSHLRGLEEKYGAPATRMSFRDKDYGWGQYAFTAEFENGKKYRRTAMSDPYFWCFLRSSAQRLSCHGCKFSADHKSDIVLADFWRCYQFDVDRNDSEGKRKGISLVLAMTPKGLNAIEDTKGMLHLEELDIEKASYNLAPRKLNRSKLPEIRRDQYMANKKGVRYLRRRILTPKERLHFAFRQFVMDRPCLRRLFPGTVGNGQIVR